MGFCPSLCAATIRACAPEMDGNGEEDKGQDEELGVEVTKLRALPDAVPFRIR